MSFPEIMDTDRLRMRPLSIEDAQEMFNTYASDAGMTPHVTWEPHKNVEETRSVLKLFIEADHTGAAIFRFITDRENGKILGMFDVRPGERPEAGWVIARPYWGKGYMTESLRALLNVLREQGGKTFSALAAVENQASWRVMEKAGMSREMNIEKHVLKEGKPPRDMYRYTISLGF